MINPTNKIIFLILSIIFCSCTPKISKTIFSKENKNLESKITLLTLHDQIPQNAKILGKIKLGYNPISKSCDYKKMILNLKKEAKKMGGNVIKITNHIPYNTIFSKSTCHKITASILHLSDLKQLKTKKRKTSFKGKALLKIYRFKSKSIIKYDLFFGDSLIVKGLEDNFKKIIPLKKEGKYIIRTSPKSEQNISLNIKFGKEYYLKCGEQIKLFSVKPLISLMQKKEGKQEFQWFDAKN